jgi:hypothetical protein
MIFSLFVYFHTSLLNVIYSKIRCTATSKKVTTFVFKPSMKVTTSKLINQPISNFCYTVIHWVDIFSVKGSINFFLNDM